MIIIIYSGKTLEYHLINQTMTISWSNVFETQTNHGTTLYEVYIGTQQAAADFVLGLETSKTELSFTSQKLIPPTAVYCIVTAINPAGLSVSYNETIYL